MKQQVPEKSDAEDNILLFVYGTLRRGGVSHHYLEGYPLIQSGFRLPGYALYDAGWYPFAVRADINSTITGDLIKVPPALLPVLDEYEGSEYVRHFRPEEKLLLYLKKNEVVQGYPLVQGGDWLKYLEMKNH